jgi:cytidine deaminase
MEFASHQDTPIYIANTNGIQLTKTIGELLPYAFTPEFLEA